MVSKDNLGIRIAILALLSLMLLPFALSCGSDSGGASACDPLAQTGCQDGQVCENVNGGEPACFEPLTLRGKVIDPETGQPIVGARVVALDANSSAVSNVAITDSEGNYELELFATTRDADGTPTSSIFLRADADGYQTFPGGTRAPFPLDLSDATLEVGGYVFDNALTQLALTLLAPGAPTGMIDGMVDIPQDRTSVLVVAELTNGDPCPALPENDCSGIAGEDGNYTIFNLPAGTYRVKAFVQGSNYTPVDVSLADGQEVEASLLAINGQATSTFNGKVNIVNPGMGSDTSVILVVASTFNRIDSNLLMGVPVLTRGQTPPGLRVSNVSGDFTLEGIPEGNYFVLAAFENDFLVRDPDVCIAGTEIVEQAFAFGEEITLENPFKITGSIDGLSPDNNEIVGTNPTFFWEDDSSEDQYQISVLDSFGNIIWETLLPASTTSVAWDSDGMATENLQPGNFYQFRIFSVKDPQGMNCNLNHAISSSEDLRGVFQVQ